MVHFSYEASNEKFTLVGLQGMGYKLYNPEFATIQTLFEILSVEKFFSTGNVRETAINNFLQYTNAMYFALS